MRTLRLAYQSEDVRAQVYWLQMPGSANMLAPLNFNDLHLADIMPIDFNAHTINAEAQWMLPSFYEPLLIIVGGVGRASYLASDQLLDGETYTDITSSRYRKPGITHWEGRAGAFVHTEYSPTNWVTINGDLRFDYNTVTEEFLSPRLALVFRPSSDHFIRLGAARSFRKPAFMETHAHLNVVFPPDSPITGGDQETFREFMTRGLGNPKLENERLLSFEAGYRGEFLEKRLSVSLDLYYNLYTHRISINENLIENEQGLPDLEQSSFLFVNRRKRDRTIFGSELAVRYHPSRNLSLLASWTYREEIETRNGKTDDGSPQNLMILGGRYKNDSGLLLSLYAFTRSELRAGGVPSPGGLLEGNIDEYIDHVVLLLGKIGWRSIWTHDLKIEFGLKLFLPISPFQAPHFRYSESGHWVTPTGQHSGGDLLRRMVTAYLQGSF
jgi:outer membrane receptor for ferrienterochelin and colicin